MDDEDVKWERWIGDAGFELARQVAMEETRIGIELDRKRRLAVAEGERRREDERRRRVREAVESMQAEAERMRRRDGWEEEIASTLRDDDFGEGCEVVGEEGVEEEDVRVGEAVTVAESQEVTEVIVLDEEEGGGAAHKRPRL